MGRAVGDCCIGGDVVDESVAGCLEDENWRGAAWCNGCCGASFVEECNVPAYGKWMSCSQAIESKCVIELSRFDKKRRTGYDHNVGRSSELDLLVRKLTKYFIWGFAQVRPYPTASIAGGFLCPKIWGSPHVGNTGGVEKPVAARTVKV